MPPRLKHHSLFPVLLVAAALLLPGCASLHPDYEKPTVVLKSLRPDSSDNDGPAFEISLGVINPNASDLSIEGIVYTIALEGNEVVKGVGKDFPVIEGYSEQTITLSGNANLIAGIRFFLELATSELEDIEYEFTAKIDLKGTDPTIRLKETGKLDLGRFRNAAEI